MRLAPAPIFLGLALGGSLGWFAPRLLAPSPATGSDIASSHPVALPAWSWRDGAQPPALAIDSTGAAIAAWLGLRAPDGSPAAFSTRVETLRALLVRLPTEAFPRLLNPLSRAGRSDDDLALRKIAFAVWLESDPTSAAVWAAASPDTHGLARQALSAWSARDPRAAAAWACGLGDQQTARDFAARTLPALATIDPAQALALASSRGDDFLEAIFPALLDTLAKSDPASAIQTYGPRIWKDGKGFGALQGALGQWMARDPASAIAWLAAQPATNPGALGQQLAELADYGPQRLAIANALATMPGISSRQSNLSSVVAQWAQKDAAAAVAWLDTLSDRHLRNAILERIARYGYSAGPEQSLTLALAMPEGSNRTDRVSQLVGQWAQKDASAALAWLRANSAAPGVASAGDSVQASILSSIARDEPATAVAEWQALPDGPLKIKAIPAITAAWGQSDPAAALRWSSEQTAKTGSVYYHQPETLVFDWARKDGPAALRWAEALSENAGRLDALRAIGGTWNGKAPRAATADLYAQIQDPALRTRFVTEHVQEWLAKDRSAAKAWLESHDALTPAEAAALLSAK